MLKRQYRILKHIYKHPEITKSALLQKFPDFQKHEKSISEYVQVTDKNKDIVSETQEMLHYEASKKHMTVSEQTMYVNKNMPKNIQNTIDDSLITYSAKLNFQEYLENKKHKAFLFWLPYIITTFIALISAAPTIYKIIIFILNLLQKSTP